MQCIPPHVPTLQNEIIQKSLLFFQLEQWNNLHVNVQCQQNRIAPVPALKKHLSSALSPHDPRREFASSSPCSFLNYVKISWPPAPPPDPLSLGPSDGPIPTN
jgi:hypothetical protein